METKMKEGCVIIGVTLAVFIVSLVIAAGMIVKIMDIAEGAL